MEISKLDSIIVSKCVCGLFIAQNKINKVQFTDFEVLVQRGLSL